MSQRDLRIEAPEATEAERGEMFSYYDAQAETYEAFYRGDGQAIAALREQYPIDTAAISELLQGFGRGHVLDLACGTGFWLSRYGRQATAITLVDQSAPALEQCRNRIRDLELNETSRIVQGDLFAQEWRPATFDAALVGFLLSHLTAAQVDAVLEILRRSVRTGGELAIIDGAWSEARKPHREKLSFETRRLADGRAFQVRKQYFERAELEALLERHGFYVTSAYTGQVFLAVRSTRRPA